MCAIEPSPVLETRRLRLRAPEQRDVAAISQGIGDFEVSRMLLTVPHPYKTEDAESWLKTVQGSDPALNRVFLVEHEDEGFAGVVGFHTRDNPYPEIGYWIAKPFWGRGFATEAALAAIDWAQRFWKKKLLGSNHFADNPASGRVLSKCGFLYTGQVLRKRCLARAEDVDSREMVWLA